MSKTHYESLEDLRKALVDLYYTAIAEAGNSLVSFGDWLIESAEEAQMGDGSGLIYDACGALESLSNYNPEITPEMYAEINEGLKNMVGQAVFYGDDGELVLSEATEGE